MANSAFSSATELGRNKNYTSVACDRHVMRHGRHYINFTLRGPAIGAKLGVFQVPQPPDNQSDCSICLASMDGSEPLFEMPCGHVFHERCISTWLQQKSECAMCRQAVPPGCSRLPKAHTPQGWMLSGLGGSLVHAGEFYAWDGQPDRNELKEGDVVVRPLRLPLPCSVLTLSVWCRACCSTATRPP